MSATSLQAMKILAQAEADAYDICWDNLENPEVYQDMLETLAFGRSRIVATEALYNRLLPVYMTTDELTRMMIKTQDMLLDSYVCDELLNRLKAIESVTNPG